MAGTVVGAYTPGLSVQKYRWEWTSSAGGAADHTTDQTFDGKVVGVETDPDGTDVPSSYAITITDEDGNDLLLGTGTGRSTSATEYMDQTTTSAVANSRLTLGITGAGNAKKGVATIVVWRR